MKGQAVEGYVATSVLERDLWSAHVRSLVFDLKEVLNNTDAHSQNGRDIKVFFFLRPKMEHTGRSSFKISLVTNPKPLNTKSNIGYLCRLLLFSKYTS